MRISYWSSDGGSSDLVGAVRLAGSTRFEFAYTPMSEASGSGASRYVVQSGESLIDIAQAAYGDGALWYVVADANGVVAEPADPLPSTEIGKAYELPDVVRSTHSATTSDSFGLADIVGNDQIGSASCRERVCQYV